MIIQHILLLNFFIIFCLQFISDASHELKTPLAVIEANADVLEGEVGKNKWMDYIQNEIQSMDKLINELLLLTKIENVSSTGCTINFDIFFAIIYMIINDTTEIIIAVIIIFCECEIASSFSINITYI